MRPPAALLLCALVLSPLFACAAPRDPLATGPLRATPVGRFDFESPAPGEDETLGPEELSGITWVEGNRYLAIGDAHAVVHPMTVEIDAKTGAVRSAAFGAPILLRDTQGSRVSEPAMAKDREGIAYDPNAREIWIANEQTGADARWPSLERYTMEGAMAGVVRMDSDPALEPFLHARGNRSFESLTRTPDGSAWWTANEDALAVDGPVATDSAGTVVRLLELDPGIRPRAQFAYPLDSYGARIRNLPIVAGREINGVCDLAALSADRLLVLERAFGGDSGGNASLRSRLYLVDVAGATDVSRSEFRSGLVGKRYVPVKKTLLWEERWGLTDSNFEGMTLGPALPDGSRLLVLIADNNGGSAQALFTLRLRRR